MKNNILISISASILLAACGGGGGSDNNGGGTPPESTTETGVLLDSPVQGIGFRTATHEGVTSSAGEYDYEPGETVVFFIGDLEFPAVAAADVVTPLDMAGTTDLSDPVAINILRLLQTLDQDGNPDNGITINIDNAAPVDFTLPIEEFAESAAVMALILNAGRDTPVTELVSIEEALSHFEETLDTTVNLNLIGAWDLQLEFEDDIETYVIFTQTGEFFFFNHTGVNEEGCRETGYEYGTYEADQDSVTFTRVVDTNGCVGLFDEAPTVSFTLEVSSADQLIVTSISDEPDFPDTPLRRLASETTSIVGAWHEPLFRNGDGSMDDGGNGLSLLLLFLPDGRYYNMDADPSSPSDNNFEIGTYNYSSASAELELIPTFIGHDEIFQSIVIDVFSIGATLELGTPEDVGSLDRVAAGVRHDYPPRTSLPNDEEEFEAEIVCRQALIPLPLGQAVSETFDTIERGSCLIFTLAVDEGVEYQLLVQDEWSGLGNGADTVLVFFESDEILSEDDEPLQVNNDNSNKQQTPISYTAQATTTLYVLAVNDIGSNPSEPGELILEISLAP